ncbi:MAG: arylsulfatase [Lentisphaeria bacterium]|nr:arylsulfatase [Lentisphaeria bacterium]
MARKPNVVLVLTDDQGYPPMACHGHPFLQTPSLDALHADAVRFEQFHTGTTCAPTRAGLLTGHTCNSTGVWHTIGGRSLLRADEWTLAQALKDNGYRTGMFGKWHLGDDMPYRPGDRGFDTVVCHGGGGISQQPDWWGNDYFDDTYAADGTPRPFEGYCTDVFFGQALDFIARRREEPFFCYIATNAPHGPFNVEPRYAAMYRRHTSSEQYARFLGMITNIDENVGRLRQTLARLGLEDDTILIFMSDNGQTGLGEPVPDMFTAGMRGLKGSEYDGGHRVPCFVRWPNGNLKGGRTVHELSSYVDLMPTLLDLCGIPVPEDRSFHGDSLTPLLRGETADHWRERIVVTDTQRVAHPIKWRKSCAMMDRWRLVNRDELYDIQADPLQQRNIADHHPEIVARLRAGYEEWWRICSEQMQRDIPFSLGLPEQEQIVLRTHDLRNEQDHSVVWNQAQVRNGDICHGYWEIRVERPGTYEFELRRWPKEAGHRIQGGIEGPDVDYRTDGIAPGAQSHYAGGKALRLDTATLMISGMPQQSAPVGPDDRAAVFRVDLEPGPHHLRAMFSNGAGLYAAAYYVYVRRVPPQP